MEYGDGDAGAVPGAPHLGLTGYEASLGYSFSNSIQPAIGWQQLTYERPAEVLQWRAAHRAGRGIFLHLNLKTTG